MLILFESLNHIATVERCEENDGWDFSSDLEEDDSVPNDVSHENTWCVGNVPDYTDKVALVKKS